jgi:hypothetical protein
LIDFRYHLVSIVAVFLALAVGIVLGSTELQGRTLSVLSSANNSLKSQYQAAAAQRDAYQAQANGADAFLQSSELLLLGDGKLLAGQKIVLITEPGAPDSVISGVTKAATDAGATVTGQVALTSAFNDLSGTSEARLSSVNGSISARQGITLGPVTDNQTGYQQNAAQLIAAAILQKTAPATTGAGGGNSGGNQSGLSDGDAQTLLQAYAQASFITVSGSPTIRATLAIIVPPGGVPSDGESDPTNRVLVAIAQDLASASAVTVIAGPTAASGQPGSAISVVRSFSVSGQVSTIDNADTTQGQITVMQAIATQLAGGKASSYGISGANSVSPVPAPTPTATATPTAPPTTGHPSTRPTSGKQVKR